MGYLYQYRRLIVVLVVWVFACLLHFFWEDIGPRMAMRDAHLVSTDPTHRQQEPVSSNSSTEPTRIMFRATLLSNSKTKHPDKNLTTNSGTFPTKLSFTTSSFLSTILPSLSSNSRSSSSVNHTSIDDAPKLLCVRFTGRLGNELFEYASTLGLALTLKRTPVFQGSVFLRTALKNFKESTANLSSSELGRRCKKARGMGEVSCCKYREQMTQLDPQYDYRIGTYLQSYRYFDNHRAEIRKAITFSDKIQTPADKIVQELRQKHKSSTLVGVHIRHGDMATKHFQRVGYPLASPDYINKSLSYFSQLYPNCVFVVASDSVQWCKENFPKGYNVSYLSGNEPAVDMLILASLDHVITSFGSFSWWIGYLSHGRVVYMKDFIRANTYIGNTFNPKGRDYIYPGWTPL